MCGVRREKKENKLFRCRSHDCFESERSNDSEKNTRKRSIAHSATRKGVVGVVKTPKKSIADSIAIVKTHSIIFGERTIGGGFKGKKKETWEHVKGIVNVDFMLWLYLHFRLLSRSMMCVSLCSVNQMIIEKSTNMQKEIVMSFCDVIIPSF